MINDFWTFSVVWAHDVLLVAYKYTQPDAITLFRVMFRI